MSLILTATANPGVASWTDGGSAVTTNTPVRSIMSTASVALTNPNNAYTSANSPFTGSAATTVTVPYTGTWIAEFTFVVLRNGAIAGTAIQQSMITQYVVNGSGVGTTGGLSLGYIAVDSFYYQFTHRYRASFNENDTIGVYFGFGGAQAATITSNAGAILTISPTQ